MTTSTVLVVEDNDDHLRWLVATLRPQYTVLSASSGREAQSIFKHYQHDIEALILDIRLPDMTAFELLNSLEKMCFAGIPATIIQSEYDDQNWMRELFGEFRALSYLVKPFEGSELLLAVRAAIEANPYTYKGIQIDERLAVMSSLNSLRLTMYHHVTQLAPEVQTVWMPDILDLFRVDGSHSESEFPSGSKDDFKLTASLIPVFELVRRFYGIEIPKPPIQRIGVHPEFMSAMGGVRSLLETDEMMTFKWVEIEDPGLEDNLDFWVHYLSLNNLVDWQALSYLFLPRPTVKLVQGMAVIPDGQTDLLQYAVKAGVPHVLFRSENFTVDFASYLKRIAVRQFELKTLHKITTEYDLIPLGSE